MLNDVNHLQQYKICPANVNDVRISDKDKCSLSQIISEMLIEVFVHSFSPYMDVDLYREMSMHPFCAPGLADQLVNQAVSKFRGRILPREDLTVLEQVLLLKNKTNGQIKIYDVSRMTDKIKAMTLGIRKTPAVIVNGEKLVGLEEIMKGISKV